ncbi:MAG: hypothetical protein U1C53_01545, partial [Candidatus Veblenbacteria bacterium]|nr:hypothetical protein [Candidatus Veblenbacteria bacterium]
MYKNVFMLSRQELIQLTPTDVGDSTLKSLELQRILSAYGDFFSYDYANSHNHKKTIPPHAVLPNARHADVYVTGSLFKSALRLGIFAQQLAKRLSLGKEILELTPRQK